MFLSRTAGHGRPTRHVRHMRHGCHMLVSLRSRKRRRCRRGTQEARDREDREQAEEQRPNLHALIVSQFASFGKTDRLRAASDRQVEVSRAIIAAARSRCPGGTGGTADSSLANNAETGGSLSAFDPPSTNCGALHHRRVAVNLHKSRKSCTVNRARKPHSVASCRNPPARPASVRTERSASSTSTRLTCAPGGPRQQAAHMRVTACE